GVSVAGEYIGNRQRPCPPIRSIAETTTRQNHQGPCGYATWRRRAAAGAAAGREAHHLCRCGTNPTRCRTEPIRQRPDLPRDQASVEVGAAEPPPPAILVQRSHLRRPIEGPGECDPR